MSQSTIWPDGPEFDRFLHAAVGEDRNGALVTVFSTLARLGLDPRKEASELAVLSDAAALHRMDALLARFLDVPALTDRHHSVAQAVVQLLPRRNTTGATGTIRQAQDGLQGTRGLIVPVVAVLLLIAMLAQLFVTGLPGTGQ